MRNQSCLAKCEFDASEGQGKGLSPDAPGTFQLGWSVIYSLSWDTLGSKSLVQLFVTPWTVVYQAPPSMGFSRKEYWSELPFPSPKGAINTISGTVGVSWDHSG